MCIFRIYSNDHYLLNVKIKIYILSIFTLHNVLIPYTCSDVILCIIWRHKTCLHLIWLKSLLRFCIVWDCSSCKVYSIHQKCYKKQIWSLKSIFWDIHISTVTSHFADFIWGKISITCLNIPVQHTFAQDKTEYFFCQEWKENVYTFSYTNWNNIYELPFETVQQSKSHWLRYQILHRMSY
jgi:hypothetical protein